ncbi:uncharacterized protein AB675_1353 [Cyphellophora attinorum]|uniref:Uncharacterized protein n=1 Tax=Cyphellophora attinorum TaxID=1664694 RepID=A0A0N1HHD1_9EURO|nr:uncharacterized protein AB675_1353 [Phialophora attinorum]KPI35143.1 hypothetical protein AB675_1353 [Phialophora attinorum]
MSYLARSIRSSRAATLLTARRHAAVPATFHTSSINRAMSEADHRPLTPAHKDDDKRSEKIDTHKHDSVGKAKSGEGEWKPELASQSEQVAQHENNDMSMKEMQDMGAKKAEDGKRPSGSESSKKA